MVFLLLLLSGVVAESIYIQYTNDGYVCLSGRHYESHYWFAACWLDGGWISDKCNTDGWCYTFVRGKMSFDACAAPSTDRFVDLPNNIDWGYDGARKQLSRLEIDRPRELKCKHGFVHAPEDKPTALLHKGVLIVKGHCIDECSRMFYAWSGWSTCSATCGTGTRTRAAKKNGCNQLIEKEECTEDPCPVHCELSEWSEWGACNRTCGDGMRIRTRWEAKRADYGGRDCDGEKEDYEECNLKGCPVNCTVAEWTKWSNCTESCGGGTQNRSRSIETKAANGGKCDYNLMESQDCNREKCPDTTMTPSTPTSEIRTTLPSTSTEAVSDVVSDTRINIASSSEIRTTLPSTSTAAVSDVVSGTLATTSPNSGIKPHRTSIQVISDDDDDDDDESDIRWEYFLLIPVAVFVLISIRVFYYHYQENKRAEEARTDMALTLRSRYSIATARSESTDSSSSSSSLASQPDSNSEISYDSPYKNPLADLESP